MGSVKSKRILVTIFYYTILILLPIAVLLSFYSLYLVFENAPRSVSVGVRLAVIAYLAAKIWFGSQTTIGNALFSNFPMYRFYFPKKYEKLEKEVQAHYDTLYDIRMTYDSLSSRFPEDAKICRAEEKVKALDHAMEKVYKDFPGILEKRKV